jgi:hypothetical protein
MERKVVAEYFAPLEHRAVLFRMFDNRPNDALIWKTIRPAFANQGASTPINPG